MHGILHFIGVVGKADEKEAQINVFPEYCLGLEGIEDYSHIIVLYWFHERDNEEDRKTLQVYPRRHEVNTKKGVFACRSPSRPNPIGLSVVKLLRVNRCSLTVENLDAYEGTPIVDIKPYLPRADSLPNAKVPEWTNTGPAT